MRTVHSFVTILLLCLMLALAAPLLAQQPQATALQAFNAKDYAGYLTNLTQALTISPTHRRVTMEDLLVLAIALDKTKGWGGESDKQAREVLAQDAVSLHLLDGLRLLLSEDTTSLATMFDAKRLPTDGLFRGQWLFRQHGYPLAENCFSAIAPDMPGKRVHAWLSIPKDKRAPVDALMEQLVDGTNKRLLGEAALSLYVSSAANSAPDAGECLALALRWAGPEKVYGILTVSALIARHKPQEARQVLEQAMAHAPFEAELPCRTCNELWTHGYQPEAIALYRQTMHAMAEPQLRNVRLAYLDKLLWLRDAKQTLPDAGDLQALQQDVDPLLAADAHLAQGDVAEAARRYAALLQQKHLALGQRIDAWGGLLDAAPEQAMPAAPALLADIGALNATTRLPLFLWFGQRLRVLMEQSCHWAPHAMASNVFSHRFPAPPIADVAHCNAQLAALFTNMLALDAVTCCRTDPGYFNPSLRSACACIYLQTGQTAQAAELLCRRITFDVPPPTGGWHDDFGAPVPHADEAHHLVSPTREELVKSLDAVVDAVRYNRDAQIYMRTAPVVAQVAHRYFQLLDAEKDSPNFPLRQPANARLLTPVLGRFLSDAVYLADPSSEVLKDQPRPAVDVAGLATLDTDLRAMLANPAYAPIIPGLLEGDWQHAMLAAHDPKLQEFVFGLLTAALDNTPTNAGSIAQQLAGVMEGYQGNDLKAYAGRLREKYPAVK